MTFVLLQPSRMHALIIWTVVSFCHPADVVRPSCVEGFSLGMVHGGYRYSHPHYGCRLAHDEKSEDPHEEHHVEPQQPKNSAGWQRVGPPLVTVTSPWLTVVAERYDVTTTENKHDQLPTMVDYWRIQRASSVIVIVLHQNHFILPAPQFRPGVQRYTLDFVGGRRRQRPRQQQEKQQQQQERYEDNEEDEPVLQTAANLLRKELHLPDAIIASAVRFVPLNNNENEGWPVDSSVSNQELYGVVALIDDDAVDAAHTLEYPGNVIYPVHQVDQLFLDLACLQCRSVLLEWLRRTQDSTVN